MLGKKKHARPTVDDFERSCTVIVTLFYLKGKFGITSDDLFSMLRICDYALERFENERKES